MKPRSWAVVSSLALALATLSTGAIAASLQHGGRAAELERMEACFQAHGKLMGKPALMNVYACWRVHGYLMAK